MKTTTELKNELLNTLEERYNNNKSYYYKSGDLALLIKLVRGTEESDPDFKMALEDGTALTIIELFLDCYSSTELLEHLSLYDFDIFNNYRYADIERVEDYESFEDFVKNSGCFYNEDPEQPDVLLYNEETGVYVKSW